MLSHYFFEILKNKKFDLSKSELQAEPNRSYYKRVKDTHIWSTQPLPKLPEIPDTTVYRCKE